MQINAIAFADNNPSNNPMLRQFDLTYKMFGISAKNPEQRPYSIPAGASQVIYDGTRTTAIDSTTSFDVSKPYLDKSVYRITWNGSGTAPNFRTDRLIGVTTATQFTISTNGPIATFTHAAGPFSSTNIQVGDILLVQEGAGTSVANQGRFVIVAKTTSTFSIQNPDAAAETFTVLDPSKFLIYSNGGSNNQVQIGDGILISSGFSAATFGSYTVLEVTPTWVEFAVGAYGGIPIETNIIPTSTGLVFYKAIKQFVLVAAQQKIYLQFNDDVSD
ncbi:MAG: hypothetical protein NZM26_04635, partial [Patescibacteria group bacterium]|nr:hypothetical protein [Patescibacteria group bacterium]